jgi:hypothetical protein
MFHDGGSSTNNSNNDDADAIPTTFRPHKPMRIPNIYSDNIYQSHLCRSFAIPPQWLKQTSVETTSKKEDEKTAIKRSFSSSIKEVDTVLIDDLTPTTFFTDYEERNQPVVVRGAANGKAVDRWKDWDYLTNKNSTSKTSYRSTSGAAPLPGNFSLEAYRDYTRSTTYLEESPLYLFDRTAFATNKEWKDDFFPEFYKKCPYWDPLHQARNVDHLDTCRTDRPVSIRNDLGVVSINIMLNSPDNFEGGGTFFENQLLETASKAEATSTSTSTSTIAQPHKPSGVGRNTSSDSL